MDLGTVNFDDLFDFSPEPPNTIGDRADTEGDMRSGNTITVNQFLWHFWLCQELKEWQSPSVFIG